MPDLHSVHHISCRVFSVLPLQVMLGSKSSWLKHHHRVVINSCCLSCFETQTTKRVHFNVCFNNSFFFLATPVRSAGPGSCKFSFTLGVCAFFALSSCLTEKVAMCNSCHLNAKAVQMLSKFFFLMQFSQKETNRFRKRYECVSWNESLKSDLLFSQWLTDAGPSFLLLEYSWFTMLS